MGVTAEQLDRARALAKDAAAFIAYYGFTAHGFDVFRRTEEGDLVPDQEAEFSAYLESLYSDTAALVDQWNGVVTEDVLDAVLIATVGQMPLFRLEQQDYSTAFAAVGKQLSFLSNTSFISRLTDVESGLLSVRLWIERHRVTGFPIEAMQRRLDEEWAMTIKALSVRQPDDGSQATIQMKKSELAKTRVKRGIFAETVRTVERKFRNEGRHWHEPSGQVVELRRKDLDETCPGWVEKLKKLRESRTKSREN
jgi:hypothetical protein